MIFGKEELDFMDQYFELLPSVTIIHNLQAGGVVEYICSRGEKLLGCSLQELKEMGVDYLTRFFNAEESKEYVPKILGLLERNNSDEMVSYFQQVKLANTTEYAMWLSCTKIYKRDNEGKPILIITTTIPVDPEHNFSSKVTRLIEENNFIRKNREIYSSLTKREKEILVLMANDTSGTDIAAKLFLSEDTVKTHRRNIKKKISANNYFDVVRFAQSFGLI